jgi:hypothetical protein
MSLNQRLQGLNEQSKFASDFLQRERERYSKELRENAKATVDAINKTSGVAYDALKHKYDLENKEGKEKSLLNAEYQSGKGKWITEGLNELRAKLAARGEYDYAADLKAEQIGKQNLIDKINLTKQQLELDPTNTDARDEYNRLTADFYAGNYGAHVGDYALPTSRQLDARWAGTRYKPKIGKQGTKLILPKSKFRRR